MKISIAISIHNRHETAKECVKQWRKYLPKDARLFIVDDGSVLPFPGADIRNEKTKGIAECKNQCISLCDDADFIFLSDDDFWPTSNDWHLPYIESGLNHVCYTFNRTILKETETYISYKDPSGCFLFMTNQCIKTVGGFDTDFKVYGFEHVNFSDRIYNNGLTPERYIDLKNRPKFISLDEKKLIQSSVDIYTRAETIPLNRKLRLQNQDSKEFKPYK